MTASLCYIVGRIEEAVQYADAGRLVIDSGEFDDVPFGQESMLGGAYSVIGQPERAVEWGRAQLARRRDTHGITAGNLVLALVWAGRKDEAMTLANDLVDSAEATRNPWCPRSHCSATATPSAKPIPPARWTPCAGAW